MRFVVKEAALKQGFLRVYSNICWLHASSRFLASLILRPRIWRRYVPPKRRSTFNRLYGFTSQKTKLLIADSFNNSAKHVFSKTILGWSYIFQQRCGKLSSVWDPEHRNHYFSNIKICDELNDQSSSTELCKSKWKHVIVNVIVVERAKK
jgi:hypothetical protein